MQKNVQHAIKKITCSIILLSLRFQVNVPETKKIYFRICQNVQLLESATDTSLESAPISLSIASM